MCSPRLSCCDTFPTGDTNLSRRIVAAGPGKLHSLALAGVFPFSYIAI
jgi:hypothetical protein